MDCTCSLVSGLKRDTHRRWEGCEPSVLQDGDAEPIPMGGGVVGVAWGDPDFTSVHLPSVWLVTFSR